MTTIKQDFVDAAVEIFEEFLDFQFNCLLSNVTSYDNEESEETKVQQTVAVIELERKQKVVTKDELSISVTEILLVGLFSSFGFLPEADKTKIETPFQAEVTEVVVDSAQAAIIIKCRVLQ